MSMDIDPREVLKCLNELGYIDISSKQLKEFIKDLKTLIKYDQKRKARKDNEENLPPPCMHPSYYKNEEEKYVITNLNDYDENNIGTQVSINNNDEYLSEVFNYLHSTSTFSSRAKETPKKQNFISVEITRPCTKPKVIKQKSCSACPEVPKQKPRTSKSAPHTCTKTNKEEWNLISEADRLNHATRKRKNLLTQTDSTNKTEWNADTDFFYSNLRRKNIVPCDTVDNVCKTSINLKPKSSFIRPRKALKKCKSDPVTLYQHYQEEWKKQKLPGENKHFNLRWAIRERMLGEPKIKPFVSQEHISKKSSRF